MGKITGCLRAVSVWTGWLAFIGTMLVPIRLYGNTGLNRSAAKADDYDNRS